MHKFWIPAWLTICRVTFVRGNDGEFSSEANHRWRNSSNWVEAADENGCSEPSRVQEAGDREKKSNLRKKSIE